MEDFPAKNARHKANRDPVGDINVPSCGIFQDTKLPKTPKKEKTNLSTKGKLLKRARRLSEECKEGQEIGKRSSLKIKGKKCNKSGSELGKSSVNTIKQYFRSQEEIYLGQGEQQQNSVNVKEVERTCQQSYQSNTDNSKGNNCVVNQSNADNSKGNNCVVNHGTTQSIATGCKIAAPDQERVTAVQTEIEHRPLLNDKEINKQGTTPKAKENNKQKTIGYLKEEDTITNQQKMMEPEREKTKSTAQQTMESSNISNQQIWEMLQVINNKLDDNKTGQEKIAKDIKSLKDDVDSAAQKVTSLEEWKTETNLKIQNLEDSNSFDEKKATKTVSQVSSNTKTVNHLLKLVTKQQALLKECQDKLEKNEERSMRHNVVIEGIVESEKKTVWIKSKVLYKMC